MQEQEKHLSNRKTDHIQLAFDAQVNLSDTRFNYEPLFAGHPVKDNIPPTHFAGKILKAPLWISSMTGGAGIAGDINRKLATACKTFGLGMGLGSCRPILDSDTFLSDFKIRSYIGDQPLFANLGIAQIEDLLQEKSEYKIAELLKKIEADGLIIHVNPLQEWLQPEGDHFRQAPIDIIKRVLDLYKGPVIVKEVGQGFGPKSLKALAELPLEAIEFGAQGGTNFSLLESMRQDQLFLEQFKPVSHLGHTAEEMGNYLIDLIEDPQTNIKTRGFIVSGGIQSFLDGYYHIQRIPAKTIYAQASAFLKYAIESEEALMKYTENQIKGLAMAYTYLSLRK